MLRLLWAFYEINYRIMMGILILSSPEPVNTWEEICSPRFEYIIS